VTSASVLATTYYGPGQAAEVRQRLVDVYAEVYEAKAASEPFFSVPRFTGRLDGHMAHPGWGCVVGEIGGEVVGYAYGRPDSDAEWRAMATVTAPEVREYGFGGDVFGLCELMVRVPWRGAGVARTVHDVLVEGRPEARASTSATGTRLTAHGTPEPRECCASPPAQRGCCCRRRTTRRWRVARAVPRAPGVPGRGARSPAGGSPYRPRTCSGVRPPSGSAGTANRWLPLADPVLADRLAGHTARVLDHDGTSPRARRELSAVHYVLRGNRT
jgi:hypothetical protein